MSETLPGITEQALSLPPAERIFLAQRLWESIHGLPGDEAEALADAKRRDAELQSGSVEGRSHADVMDAARRAMP